MYVGRRSKMCEDCWENVFSITSVHIIISLASERRISFAAWNRSAKFVNWILLLI